MRRIIRGRSASAIAVGLAFTAACTDRMPTLTDSDRLPVGQEPVTIDYVLQAGDFLTELFVLRGTTDARDSGDLIVARDFDGLDAHVLAQFAAFPDSIFYQASADQTFDFVNGEVRTTISNRLAASAPELDFYLWEVTEEWDSTVTWTEAVSRPASQPWQQAGGTRGELLSVTTWTQADTTAAGDTLVWLLLPEVLKTLASKPSPNFMVTMEDGGLRAELTPLTLRLRVSPGANPDTVLLRGVSSVRQRFIYSLEEPAPDDLLRVGGVTSDRTLLRMRIPELLPGCPNGNCAPIPADKVTLNRVELLLDPVPVTSGFRPVAPITIFARQLLEPELGPQAPLGHTVGAIAVRGDRFIEGGGAAVSLVVTGVVAQALAIKETEIRSCRERQGIAGCQALEDEPIEIGLALAVEPEASSFSFAWFDRNPRLRFIYTLRQVPALP